LAIATLAAQDQVVVGDPEREHRRAPHVSLPAAEKEGALARLQAGGDVLDPPRGPAQPLQGVYRLVRLQLPLEDLPCGGPLPTGERDVALPDPLVPRRDLSDVRTVTALRAVHYVIRCDSVGDLAVRTDNVRIGRTSDSPNSARPSQIVPARSRLHRGVVGQDN
jgi:hypothetical protein